MKRPVYEFLGYKTLKFDYVHENNGEFNYFSIKATKEIENDVYTLLYFLEFGFKEEQKKSSAVFSASFKINDLNWYNEIIKDNLDVNLFASVSFPFIRSTIYSMTSDSRKGIELPTIDLRIYNMTSGITFTKE